MPKKEDRLHKLFRTSVLGFARASMTDKEVNRKRGELVKVLTEKKVNISPDTINAFAVGVEYAMSRQGDREGVYGMLGIACLILQEIEIDSRMTMKVLTDKKLKKSNKK